MSEKLPKARMGWRWGSPRVLDLMVVKRGVYSTDNKIMLVSRRITGMFGLALGRTFIGVILTNDMDIHEFALSEKTNQPQ